MNVTGIESLNVEPYMKENNLASIQTAPLPKTQDVEKRQTQW